MRFSDIIQRVSEMVTVAEMGMGTTRKGGEKVRQSTGFLYVTMQCNGSV